MISCMIDFGKTDKFWIVLKWVNLGNKYLSFLSQGKCLFFYLRMTAKEGIFFPHTSDTYYCENYRTNV
jgi:hypothetical protein